MRSTHHREPKISRVLFVRYICGVLRASYKFCVVYYQEMIWVQETIELPAYKRGFHLVTRAITSSLDLSNIKIGLCHIFIQHTSASLTLNENVSPDVRRDFEQYVRHAVPDDALYFEHRLEGPDDMPAHIKASLFGSSLSIPIRNGQLTLGTWQGIYLCEHRKDGGRRTLVVTAFGEGNKQPQRTQETQR